jgi:Rieske Fe-S protein
MAEQNRRSFLKWCTHGLGAIFGAILGIPALLYLFDPRHRAVASAGTLSEAEGIDLKKLAVNRPEQGVIRATRVDAWSLYPRDVVGRVWVWLKKPIPEQGLGKEEKAEDYVVALSTTCPHLGCFVNSNPQFNPSEQGDCAYVCPCHDGRFCIDGSRIEKLKDNPTYENPAPRSMDRLDCEIQGDKLMVKWKTFKQGVSEKEKELT